MTTLVTAAELQDIATRNNGYLRSNDKHWGVSAIDTLLRAIAERDQQIALRDESIRWLIEHGPKLDHASMFYNRVSGNTIKAPEHLEPVLLQALGETR